jgi:uncharacterized protein with HEPN domain
LAWVRRNIDSRRPRPGFDCFACIDFARLFQRPARATHRALLAIRENIRLAQKFVEGLDVETFGKDQRAVYAVTRCLEIISEATRRLPDDLVGRHSAVSWQRIRGAGNVYRHKYDNVSASMLWATVDTGLDGLLHAISAEIETMEKFGSYESRRTRDK